MFILPWCFLKGYPKRFAKIHIVFCFSKLLVIQTNFLYPTKYSSYICTHFCIFKRKNMAVWHLYLMAAMYVVIGCFHFIKPKAFLSVMPRYIPNGKQMVYLSGVAEIALGIGLCFATTRVFSIWGIIAMLLIFLVVHWHMIVDKKYHEKFPKPVLWLRFFLQFGLMYWAYNYL